MAQEELLIPAFPLVDQYTGIRMGVDLSLAEPGELVVQEASVGLRWKESHAVALKWVRLTDGRSAASVPPGTAAKVRSILERGTTAGAFLDQDACAEVRKVIDEALLAEGLRPTDRIQSRVIFACNAALLRVCRNGSCQRLLDESVPPAEGCHLPTQCFPGGLAYGVIADEKVVSCAFAHPTGTMVGKVADLGVETATSYRRRGYAKATVSSVVEHVISRGGEARYVAHPGNEASHATARAVGFVPHSVSVVLRWPKAD